jgi:hypothetical protein
MRSILGVSFVWFCFVACGDGVSVGTNANNVCSEIAEVACHNLYQCCSEGEIEDFLNVSEPRTEPQCKEDVKRMCQRDIARLDEGIDKKRVKFDSEIMNNCLEALVAPSGACATVEQTVPWAEVCMNSAWVGLVADGSQCFGTFECASKDSFCAPNQTCTAKPGPGQACGISPGCSTGNFCQAGTCRPQLAENAQCTSTAQCLQPLFCDFAAAIPICTSVRDGGQPCTSDSACKSGDCIPGTCAGSTQSCFTSATCGRRCTNNGATCAQDSNCGPGQCSVTTTMMCNNTTMFCPGIETCVFPLLCQPGACVGTPVCAQAQLVVDYCQDALGDVPFPMTN